MSGADDFIRANTVLGRAPLVPEIPLHLATEITPIWQATEAWLAERNVEPPFWAFAWPGGQAFARHILDNPSLVAGKRVLDFAAGGGIAAIACALAGAASVEAAEIDRLALAAIALNAAANGLAPSAMMTDNRPGSSRPMPAGITLSGDVVGSACRWDIILCGDICYEAPMTAHILPWLAAMAAVAKVWIADPGRAYLPKTGLAPFAAYAVPTTRELEDRTVRDVVLYRLLAGGLSPG
ncbi:class I SAM-dependent methyltransferase [Rhodopila globiformis]|uniref:Nicotinamide N-methylase n=1 Tax=Rhodopila globiformis TaxID=1071 RepID=A0A2S6N2K1_RHOGL|nr:50S ribosomal protein L11 methyltransferase [Rhodopila globiformis]PPQ28854.1 nicotinamide N-methylase [Rhodopila globiformis]